jgi:hypothetical protein
MRTIDINIDLRDMEKPLKGSNPNESGRPTTRIGVLFQDLKNKISPYEYAFTRVKDAFEMANVVIPDPFQAIRWKVNEIFTDVVTLEGDIVESISIDNTSRQLIAEAEVKIKTDSPRAEERITIYNNLARIAVIAVTEGNNPLITSKILQFWEEVKERAFSIENINSWFQQLLTNLTSLEGVQTPRINGIIHLSNLAEELSVEICCSPPIEPSTDEITLESATLQYPKSRKKFVEFVKNPTGNTESAIATKAFEDMKQRLGEKKETLEYLKKLEKAQETIVREMEREIDNDGKQMDTLSSSLRRKKDDLRQLREGIKKEQKEHDELNESILNIEVMIRTEDFNMQPYYLE